jgi:uncharacterized protein (TIGR00252 family)
MAEWVGYDGFMDRNTTAIGQEAESEAIAWLERHNFEIVVRNWKTRWCEIDIVAKRCAGRLRRVCTIHFVEVKYRRNSRSGEAIEYVTPKKQEQMTYAAQSWVHEHNWSGTYQLDVISITDPDGDIIYIPNITQ